MSSKAVTLLIATMIVLCGVIVYANTLDGEWVWDDASSVLLHKDVQNPASLLELFKKDQHAFGRGAGNFYRPMVSVTFMADYALTPKPADTSPSVLARELPPFYFHLSNMAWHIAAALSLFALLRLLGAPVWVQAAACLVFVVHPLHTEAVAYISGRADMLSATFLFLGLYCALQDGTAGRRALYWSASALCFVLGLLSKESSLIFPLLLAALIALRPLPGNVSGIAAKRAYYFPRLAPLAMALGVLVVYALLRSSVLQFATPQESASSAFGTRFVETGQAFWFYMVRLFYPVHLHMEQTLSGVSGLTALLGYACLGLIAAALVVSRLMGQHRVAMGLGWFILTWLPISGLFPLNAPMAEHWMYVPMAGFWWAVAEVVYAAVPEGAAAVRNGVVYVFVLLLMALGAARNQDWHSNERLYEATLRENPHTTRVRYNLAVTHQDISGNAAGARRNFEALLDVYAQQKAGRGEEGMLLLEEIDVHRSLAHIAMAEDDFATALKHLMPLVRLPESDQNRPELARDTMDAGKCFLALGDVTSADQAFGRAAQLVPETRMYTLDLLKGAPID
ncbi:MAG: hypothetical protein HYV27_02105 [Candidatus Hydrogenedentes bacterium]|nr:hypothetical protein [Candidatus Hydrogenedentota bacterium]